MTDAMRREQAREQAQGLQQSTWPSFLRGENAAQILGRLSSGDPLRLYEGAARRLRETWFLVDVDRVYQRAMAVCAEAAGAEEAPRDLEEWKRAKLDFAIAQLVRADREAEEFAPEHLEEDQRRFPLLTECLWIEADLVRRCSVAFNGLGVLPRRAFCELVIEGRELDECIEGGPWNEDELYVAIQEALAAFDLDMGAASKSEGKQGKRRQARAEKNARKHDARDME